MAADETTRRAGAAGRGARERILNAAAALFERQGINATGVAELAAEARVSKRTLYSHFASKDELVCAYLRAARPAPEAVLGRDDLTPRARLLELFTALGNQPHPLRGDPFAAAAVELADPDHPAHRLAAKHAETLAVKLADLAREAGARNAETVGRRLALLYDGAAIQTVVRDSGAPAEEARRMAAAVLQEALDPG